MGYHYRPKNATIKFNGVVIRKTVPPQSSLVNQFCTICLNSDLNCTMLQNAISGQTAAQSLLHPLYHYSFTPLLLHTEISSLFSLVAAYICNTVIYLLIQIDSTTPNINKSFPYCCATYMN